MNLKRTSVILAALFTLAGCGAPVATMSSTSRDGSFASFAKRSTGTKRAFLVGINKYITPGNDLSGCVNDINDVKAKMLSKEGFDAANINTITDKKATRAAILKGLQDLVAAGQPGDFLYFHYSGHGAQVPDTNGDEPDGQDEILCPSDIGFSGGSFKNVVVDDEIQTILGGLKPGVGFLMISDSCHSGTVDRGLSGFNQQRARVFRAPAGTKYNGPMVYDKAAQKTFQSRVAAGQYTLISGCQDDQTSADAYINNRYNGAATYYLLEAYAKGGQSMTYKQWHKLMVDGIKANDYEQTPNIQGNQTAKIFSIPQ